MQAQAPCLTDVNQDLEEGTSRCGWFHTRVSQGLQFKSGTSVPQPGLPAIPSTEQRFAVVHELHRATESGPVRKRYRRCLGVNLMYVDPGLHRDSEQLVIR